MKYKKNCKTCQLTKGPAHEKMRLRILKANFHREPGDETLTQLAHELGVSWTSFHNHCKRHISDRSEAVIQKQTAKAIAKVEAKVMKDTEVAFDHKDVVAEMDFEKAAREIVALGIERLEKGEITVSTTQLLQAIKIKADYASKKRGQDTELIKTMYRFASGSQEPNAAIAEGPSEVDRGGSDGPGDLHYETAWDALTRRAEALSQGNPKTSN